MSSGTVNPITRENVEGKTLADVSERSGVRDHAAPQRQITQITHRLHIAAFVTAILITVGFVITQLLTDWWAAEFTFVTTAVIVVWAIALLANRLQICMASHDHVGQYVLQHKLGSGGMGDVYLAEHRLLKRLCAVKLIHSDKANDEEMLERFEREVKATAQLTHWNTVQVYDYGHTRSGRFYYSMEYLEGVNLWQFVEQHGAMPAGRVVYIMKQLCAALHEADRRQLVHRDIKPSNIFLAQRGESYDVAKLLDFGLVQPAILNKVGMRRMTTQIQGSPGYMSPEQANGLEPDCRGDLYSLGAVAYFLLTGHAPFREENPIMLIVAHATTAVPQFQDIGVDVPEDLTRIVMKCLEKKPLERYASAHEVLAELERCECAGDWDWQKAEEWWLTHSQPTTAESGVPTMAGGQTVEFEESDPEATIIIDLPENISSSGELSTY